jgi:hypothetical protein
VRQLAWFFLKEKQMPNRLQWWRDRLTHEYIWPSVIAAALLLATVVWWFWAADTPVFYLGTGVIRFPPVF